MTQNSININDFPTTRYQGSKKRLLPWIYDIFNKLKFKTALDLFGGTGSVSYLLKRMGKKVTYNDILRFNHWIGVALIENSDVRLTEEDISFLLKKHKDVNYPGFIQHTFKDIYFKPEEDEFLDIIIKNIQALPERYDDELISFYKQSMAYYSLFQSCIIKRPFNLFHRKNLYMRTNDVQRNFGNKTTWDRTFEHYFIKFALEINRSIFDNGENNKSVNFDALIFPNVVDDNDLVYIDPPYICDKIPRNVCNYYKNYHFLEGIVNYHEWHKLIDYNSPHFPLKNNGYNWNYKNGNVEGFEKIIERFQDSIIVISYKEPGLPLVNDLVSIIQQFKKSKINIFRTSHFYALNKNNGHYSEILITAE